jgi:hypothetical protein
VRTSGAAAPSGGVQGAAGWVAKLIILTDNIQLYLVKWPDDGRLAETCGRNKLVVSDGNQQNILLFF